MTDKKSLYDNALLILGERKLASLTENVEPRRVLDTVWDAGAVDACLEEGQWLFARRAAKLDYSPDVTPAFGYQFGFEKPDDFIRTAAVCTDEYYNVPLLQYTEEAGFWYSDYQEIYFKWISNDINFGGDLGKWPTSFKRYVEAYLANEAAPRITEDKNKRQEVYAIMEKRRKKAQSIDAMAEPTKFQPTGSWLSARTRNTSSRTDGGRRSVLIG